VIFADNPQGLSDYLKQQGIGTGRVFYPLHLQPCYDGKRAYPANNFPNSIWAYEHGLALPSSAKLTDAQVEHVCDVINLYQKHEFIHDKITY